MDIVTCNVRNYVKRLGIKISVLAKSTEIKYDKLWGSLSPKSTRGLSADELLKICLFLKVDPMIFLPPEILT